MRNWTREQLEARLWLGAASFALLLLVGSTVHVGEALSWANRGIMAFFLAVGIVGLQVAVVLISLANKHEERTRVKAALWAIMALLFVLEVSANFGVGSLLTHDRLPEAVATNFGLSQDAAVRLAALVYAAFLPLLNLLLIFSLMETQARWLPKAPSEGLPQDDVFQFDPDDAFREAPLGEQRSAGTW